MLALLACGVILKVEGVAAWSADSQPWEGVPMSLPQKKSIIFVSKSLKNMEHSQHHEGSFYWPKTL
jgi:hypothetical protein